MAKLMDAKGSTEDSNSPAPKNASADVVYSKIPVDASNSSQPSSNNPQEVDNKITKNQGAATPSLPQKNGISLLQKSSVLVKLIEAPDQCLLYALEIPRDRKFVMKLEQDIVNFIRENNEIFDLPPINPYHRLLAHKMAEYYRLTHVAISDATGSSVRLYRGQFATIPPVRLYERSSSKDSPSNGTVPTVKIMKRLQSNSTSSKSSSKDASPKVTTRAEKEAAYFEARARIFKNFYESSDLNPVAPPAPQVPFSFYRQSENPRGHNQTGVHMLAPFPSSFNTAAPSFAPSAYLTPQGYNPSIQNRQMHPHTDRAYPSPAMSPAAFHRQPAAHIPHPVNGQTLGTRFPGNGPAWNASNMGGAPIQNARYSSGPAYTVPPGNIPYQPAYNQQQWGANGGLPKGQ
ncbi:hypothetical protein RUND412_008351 [Rhizina undulata]